MGYDWSGPTVAAGQALYLTLYWKAEADLREDDTAFVHLGAANGDVVPDSLAIVIPTGTPAGTYPLLAGWYDSQTQQRLALDSADEALPDNRAIIANVQVTAR